MATILEGRPAVVKVLGCHSRGQIVAVTLALVTGSATIPDMEFSIPARGNLPLDGIWIRAEGRELPHPTYFRLGIGDDGKLVATGLVIAPDGELTARGARVPLADIVARFAEAVIEPATRRRLRVELDNRPEWEQDPRWQQEQPEAPPGSPDWWGALEFMAMPSAGAALPVARVRPGPHGYSDEHYQQVAETYRHADVRAPIRAVMREHHASESTATRWVREARRRGYLKDKS